jgi:hypothetical protein
MAICTFFIIRVLVISHQRMAKNMKRKDPALLLIQHQKTTANSSGAININGEDSECYEKKSALAKPAKHQAAATTAANSASHNHRLNRTIHLTYTLITINTLFFCLVSPLVIVYILIKGKQEIEDNKILINIVYLLAYSNHAFNFIFYGLSSPPYREAVFDIFKLKRRTTNNNAASKRY